MEINLEGNPTTGYRWQYYINGKNIIKEDSSWYKQNTSNSGIVGADGVYTWKFSGLREGTAEIVFEYRRPWEKEAVKTKTYICIVDKTLNIILKEK